MAHKHKKERILRLIILYKVLWGVAEIFISVSFYRFLGRNIDDPFATLMRSLHLHPENPFMGAILRQADSLDSKTLFGFTVLIFIFGIFNLVESWGLHNRYRWGEWLTVIATSALIPYELFYVIVSFGMLKVAVLVIHILIVY